MHFFNWVSGFLLAAAVAVAAKEAPTELIIETTFTPDECPQKAEKGDKIEVHYVRDLSFSCSSNYVANCLSILDI